MALPRILISATGGVVGYSPPFKSSADRFYVIVRRTTNELSARKSGSSVENLWSPQDREGAPSIAGTDVVLTTVQENDIIHIAYWTVGGYKYTTFDMSTDLWADSPFPEQIDNATNDPTNPWILMAVRSGVPVVVYAGDTDRVMGGTKERVDAAHRDGGTWTAGIALDAGGDIHYGNPNVVKGPLTDDMHLLWQQTTNTADPPTAWEGFEARTLDPSNNLSTKVTDTLDTVGALLGMNNAVSYDDSGTQRMLYAGISGASGRPRIYVPATEDGSDDISIGTTVSDTAGDDGFVNGEVGVCSITELDGELHQLFAGGGTDGVDQDLFYTTSTDDGATWSTPTEELNGVTINFLSATIYVRDINTVLAYVYDDGGVQKYNEKVLIAGQTHQMMV